MKPPLTGPFESYATVELFRRLVYAFLFASVAVSLPSLGVLWGPLSTFPSRSLEAPGPYAVFHLLARPELGDLYWLFALGLLAGCAVGFFGRAPRTCAVLVLFFFLNLSNKSRMINTGGDVLLGHLLLLLIFVQRPGAPARSPWVRDFQQTRNHAFFLALRLQIVIVYAATAWWKLEDPRWTSGLAIGYISQLDVYSLDSLERVIASVPLLGVVGSYATLAYQCCFPVLVWIPRAKSVLLIVGLLFHGLIAFGMGIFHFGVVMMLSYTLFLDETTARRWTEKLRLARADTA